VHHGGVLGDGDPVGRGVKVAEIWVECAAIVVAKLSERNREIGAQLDQREYSPLETIDTVGLGEFETSRATEVRRGVRPAVGAGEICDAASGQRWGQAFDCLIVNELPVRVR
jgi:hypothetical protein